MTRGQLDLSASERAAFDPFDNTPPGFDVADLTNVTVTRSGSAFRGLRLVPESLPPHRHRWPRLIALAWASRLRRGSHRLPEGPAYALVHSIWSGGYYHWLLESLPRLLSLEERFGTGIVPLIPDYARLGAVYRDSLAALGYAHAVPMPPGASALAPRLLVPQAPPLGQYNAPVMQRLRSRLVGAILPEGERPPHRRIYISRARARGRKVRNEADLRHLLEQRGFECVYLEEMDFAGQVRLFSQAEIVIGQHGAGLSNILFMQPGTRLIEIQRKLTGGTKADYRRVLRSYGYFSGYAKLSVMGGAIYQVLIADAADPPHHVDTDDVLVDLPLLAAKIGS